MGPKYLFSGRQWKTDIKNRLMDMARGEERVRFVERVTRKQYLDAVSKTIE